MSVKGFYISGEVQHYDYNALDNKPEDGLTEATKLALLQLARKVAYIDEHGQDYYQDLYDSFYGAFVNVTYLLTDCYSSDPSTITKENEAYNVTIYANPGYSLTGATVSITMGGTDVTGAYLNGTINIPNVTGDLIITVRAISAVSSISAVYTQSGIVYDIDALDSLKPDLVVNANYSDGTSGVVPADEYVLSGTLAEGTSTITVSYGDKTTTFTVSVTNIVPSQYTRANYIGNPTQTTSAPLVNTGVTPSTTGSLAVDIDFMMTEENTYTDSDGYKYIFAVNIGTAYATAGCCIGIAPNNYDVYAFNEKTATIEPNGTSSVLNKRLQVTAEFTPTSVSITDGTLSDNVSSPGRNHGQPIYFFGLKTRPGANYQFAYYMIGRIYGCTVRDNGTEILKAIPCIRNSDDAAGFWDVVNENFITADGLVAG